MSDPHSPQPEHSHREGGFLGLLQRGDEFAHLAVSALLLVTALGVLIGSSILFVQDASIGPDALEHLTDHALTYLSDLLFAVILLELLSTLLTYVKSKNLEATIKDFLIVGIISSVRKILLVGARASMERETNMDNFVKEAVGTAITIMGILLLIGGLIVLERRRIPRAKAGVEA